MKDDGYKRFQAIQRVVEKRKHRGAPWWKLQRYVLSQRTRHDHIFNALLEIYAEQLAHEEE